MAELRFDITGDSSGAQRANRQYATSADLAARGARLLAESLDKQKRAAAASAAATIAAAKADRILADAEDDAIASHVRLRAEQGKLVSKVEQASSKGFLGSLFGGGAAAASGGAQGASGLLENPIAAASAAVAALAALPFAAAAASAAIVTVLGGGLTAVAVIGAAKILKVQDAFGKLASSAKYVMGEMGKAIAPALVGILNTAQSTVAILQGPLVAAVKAIAGPFRQFGESLAAAFSSPQVIAAVTSLGKAFGGLLKALAPHLPVIIDAIAKGITGIAQAVGAHAKGFATFITFLGDAAGALLQFLGALTRVAAWLSAQFLTALHAGEKALHAIVASFRVFAHDVAAVFDYLRHYVAASWNATWNDTKKIVTAGIAAVVGFFKALPRKILGALFGLGHSLYAFAHAALNDLWSGFKAVGGAILNWLGGFVSRIVGLVKKILGIGSPSTVFHEIGVNMMLGLERGIKATAHRAANAAQGAIGSAGGPTSASAAQAQAYARSRLAAFGWSPAQMGPLIALWNQESGWNRFARNPSSGAYGIPQALPPGKMGAAANPPLSSAAAQINWGLGYIKSVYGSPAGAEAHERAFNWYGKGGWISEPVLGVGLRSGRGYGFGEHGPEMVVPGGRGSGGGQRIVLQFQPGSEGQLTRALVDVLTRHVRDAGGGDVQVALGTAY